MTHTYTSCPKCHTINRVDSDQAVLGKIPNCGKCQTALELHGLVSQVNTADFQKILKHSDKPIIVDFWASWCGPCRMYGPEFEKASVQKKDAIFLKINTETEQQLSASLGIRGIPCTIVFQNGKEIKRQSGAMSAQDVVRLI